MTSSTSSSLHSTHLHELVMKFLLCLSETDLDVSCTQSVGASMVGGDGNDLPSDGGIGIDAQDVVSAYNGESAESCARWWSKHVPMHSLVCNNPPLK